MILSFNEKLSRYEFRTRRDERYPDNPEGRLGLAIATSARFSTAWNGRDPLFWTADPHKAKQLASHADEETRARIKAHLLEAGAGVPVLTFKNGVYIWIGPIEGHGIVYKDIPKRAGFALTHSDQMPRGAGSGINARVWWTEQTSKAVQCADYADDLARLAIGKAVEKRETALAASRAEDADIEVIAPEGLVPYRFQVAGLAYAQSRKNVLWGDQMGLGKTIQAILWHNWIAEELNKLYAGTRVSRPMRTLVICPYSLKTHWRTEMAGNPLRDKLGWLVRPTTVGIADTKYSTVVPNTDIVIINYDILARKVDNGKRKIDVKTGKAKVVFDYELREALKIKWDLLIVDEAHRIKGDPKTTIRSRMVYSINADRMGYLTGTPIPNRVRELWFIVHRLAPKIFPSKAAFMEEFCAGGGFMDPYSGAKNLQKLQELLRTHIMVRRLAADVLKDLPPIRRQVIELPADGCEGLVREELLAFERKEDVLTTMRLRVEMAKASENPEDYTRSVAILTQGIKVAFEELSRVRRETAMAKLPVAMKHIADCLEEVPKIMVGAHHVDVIKAICDHFGDIAVSLYGGTKGDRLALAEDFNASSKLRLLVCQLDTIGFSIKAAHAIAVELSWVPSTLSQWEFRCRGIGRGIEGQPLLVQHLVLEGSLDKRMADVLVEKQDVADRALDRESVDEMLADPVTPDREKMATQGVTVKDITKLAEKMSAEDILAVHYGFQLLAGTHKDSKLLDGQTFRAIDAPLGKIFAAKKKLSPREAALGKRFISRYKHVMAHIPEIAFLFERKSDK